MKIKYNNKQPLNQIKHQITKKRIDDIFLKLFMSLLHCYNHWKAEGAKRISTVIHNTAKESRL